MTLAALGWLLVAASAPAAAASSESPGLERSRISIEGTTLEHCLALSRAVTDTTGEADSTEAGVASEADSTAGGESDADADAVADSSGVETIGLEAERSVTPTVSHSRFNQPRWIMLRSLVIPGWGQAHNHAWIKAVAVAAGDGYLRLHIVRDERNLKRLSSDANRAQARLDQSNATVTAAEAALVAARASGDANAIAAAEAALGAAQAEASLVSEDFNTVALAYNSLLDGSTNRRWLFAGVLVYALLDAYIDAQFRDFKIEFGTDPAEPVGAGSSPSLRLALRWTY